MFLRFEQHGAKHYARLPAGEYGYGEHSGLYEWRRMPVDGADPLLFPDGKMLVRIDYTGGDRQASDRSGFFTRGGSGSIQGRHVAWPAELGLHAAFDPARMN